MIPQGLQIFLEIVGAIHLVFYFVLSLRWAMGAASETVIELASKQDQEQVKPGTGVLDKHKKRQNR